MRKVVICACLFGISNSRDDILFYALFSSDVVVLPTIAMKTLNRKVKIRGNSIR